MNLLARSARMRTRNRQRPGPMQTVDSPGVSLLPLETWGNLTQGLTPHRLKTILAAADAGDILEQHILFADMEDRCDHLAAEIGKRKRALLTLDWEITPGRAGDAEAERVADAVRDVVNGLDGIEDLIMDLADGIGHGFSAVEIEWGAADPAPVPVAFHFRPQTWFQVLQENRNVLRLRDGSPMGQELWPLGWIVHTHRSRSGWLPRFGLFRTVAWAYLIRSFALDANIKYVQVHGLPFRVGKYPPGSQPEDRAALARALRAMGQDAAGIIPQGMEILFETPANATQDLPGVLITRCEQGMSKAILGGTLTSQADGKTSTNALGQVHEEVRRDLMISDAGQVAATLSRQLLTPLAMLYCGVSDPRLMPYWRFDTREVADLSVFSVALPALAPYMRISRKWAHEKTRIPMAESDDDLFQAASEPGTSKQVELAALTSIDVNPGGHGDLYPAQASIDALADDPGVKQALAEAADLLLEPVLQAIRHGADPGSVLEQLGELYPAMDQDALTDLLTRVFFVADIIGHNDKDA